MSATVFDTPLDARSLIEASAGTGKTFALAGLFARAVIVGRRRVPEVLAVTYTIAATQELHERVRRRLQAAVELAGQWHDATPAEAAGDDAETALLRRLLHAALHDGSGESLTGLRMRLARAVRDMDLAAITTIHGFCQRLLAEHALEAGQPLLAADIVPANAAQRSALAVELWREASQDPAGAEFLRRCFGTPDALATALRDLLAPDPLLPPAPRGDACATRDRAWSALRACFLETGADARDALQAAVRDRILSGAKDKAIPFDVLWGWFAQAGDGAPAQPHAQLACLTRAWLQGICLKNKEGLLPRLALCEAVETYLCASDACDLRQLHALREAARRRDGADKRASRSRDYDDLITAVFDATADEAIAPRLAAALREQFPLVLVDEFQDTDARQWAIFSRLFGDGGLLLVGDPKQAIYRFRGGDVETYLAARATAQLAAPLRDNYRSRPCVLAAINALFEHAPEDALGAGIAFVRNRAGRDAGCDAHLLIDGAPAPPLTFHQVPARSDTGKPKDRNKRDSIRIAARLCADAIGDLLHAARNDQAQRVDDNGTLRALQPRDCAVLVRTHGEGIAVREALARLGVPAVSTGRGSLFATMQAQSLLTLLLALATPGDDRRLRAALASPLFGLDAAALCALDDDGEALARWQHAFAQWRQRWELHGPQPMLADVVARQAPRLLALADGERELTYLLQLGELMQEARAQRLGPQGQLDWLRGAIAHADGEDETQQPRLESDAGRVQILTLHASKGLEFPLVFLPFVGIGRGNGNAPDFVAYHDAAGERVRQWRTDTVQPGALPWRVACERAKDEERAEDMRLLYVGLTRARDAVWLCGGAFASNEKTALSRLLGGPAPGAGLREALDGLLQVREGLPAGAGERLAPQDAADIPPARTPQRLLQRDWWIHSFSQLHRQRPQATHAPADEAPADDERPLASLDAGAMRFGGTRFGNALHQALEHVDFERWRDAAGERVPDGEVAVLRKALRDQDYAEADLEDGARELASLVARTLNAPLGVRGARDARLCDVPAAARIAELEFHFTLADADTGALLALLQSHGIVRERSGFGASRLNGLMTGKIDLTCRVDGRLYVLDYKSNRLPDYAADTLRSAMRSSEYDLQALLYVVALHRWLRMRRGDGYDFARDLGGVRYLFCRGLDPARPGEGIVAMEFDRGLIEAVDALFAPDRSRA
ncbi:MAG TPA: exodeoxyribonuclease V subunit beta [Luteimonas sp.]|nr:exodeoxyribonuclease V subunit beta [Luteimonas sp.]